jgi:hypothetical protein
VDGTGSGLFPVVGFGISDVEPSSPVYAKVKCYGTNILYNRNSARENLSITP